MIKALGIHPFVSRFVLRLFLGGGRTLIFFRLFLCRVLVEINFSTSPVTIIIVIIIFLGRVFRLDAEEGGKWTFFFSPMKEFLNVGLKMFYVDYRGMRFLFFFFFWSEKNLNKTFSSLLLINVTNKIWKLKIFV